MKIKNLLLVLLLLSLFAACGSPDEQMLNGIEKNDVKSVQKAITKGGNLEVLNSEKYTPLMMAIMKKADKEIIKFLLDKGANPNAKITVKEGNEEKEKTPLYYVAESGDIELTKLLLDHGGDPNIKLLPDSILTKVIYKYVRTDNKNYLTIAKILLEKGADPNIKSDKNNFCPMLAAMLSDKEAETFESVKLLLDYGAMVGIFAQNGDTALSVSQSRGHQDIVNLLKSKNQSQNSLWMKIKQQGLLNKTTSKNNSKARI